MERIGISPSRELAPSATPVAGLIALALLVVGGVNWAFVGLFNIDLVAALLGPMSSASRVVYLVMGVAAVYALTLFPRLPQRH